MDAELPNRRILAEVFKDPRLLLAVERVFQLLTATGLPAEIEAVQQAAAGAQTTANEADAAAGAAQAGVDGLAVPEYIVAVSTPTLANERVLTDSVGVTFNFGAPGQVTLSIDIPLILGFTPVDPDEPVSLGDTLEVAGLLSASAGLDVVGEARCDALRVDATPAASVTAASHALPINLDGTTYYMKLSSAP